MIRQLVWRDGKPVLEARNARMRYDAVIADESVEVWASSAPPCATCRADRHVGDR